jgi:acyl dehydratase
MTYEDFSEGQLFQTPAVFMTKEEIMTFADQYDPQYFHVDEKRADKSHFNGIIASGFHTIGKVWAEFIKLDVLGEDCIGGLGADEIRWKRPVYPKDYLKADIQVTKIAADDQKNRGVVTLYFDVKNQKEKTVLTFFTDVVVAGSREQSN